MVDFSSGTTPLVLENAATGTQLDNRITASEPPLIESSTLAVAGRILDARTGNEKRFKRLVGEWKSERDPYSSAPSDDATCLSYLKIIGIGPEAIPLILNEMRRRPDHWFTALHALTEAMPVKKEHRGKFQEMINDWIAWGKDNGYIS